MGGEERHKKERLCYRKVMGKHIISAKTDRETMPTGSEENERFLDKKLKKERKKKYESMFWKKKERKKKGKNMY